MRAYGIGEKHGGLLLIISVSKAGNVTVEDQENFRAFSVLFLAQPDDLDRIAGSVKPAITFDDRGYAWIKADAVVAWANRTTDIAWRGLFDRMIDFARPHGWIEDDPLRIRAHIDFRAEEK
jgi:hypothetical protein